VDSPAMRIMDFLQQVADDRPEWMTDPRRGCAPYTPDQFYGSDAAVVVCEECPFIDACLWYALDNNEEYGIWGGATEGQRRSLRRKMGMK
jgi:hypothetical protein